MTIYRPAERDFAAAGLILARRPAIRKATDEGTVHARAGPDLHPNGATRLTVASYDNRKWQASPQLTPEGLTYNNPLGYGYVTERPTRGGWLRKEIRELLGELERQGFRHRVTSKQHYRIFDPDGRLVATLGGTASDHRALINCISQLRRAGFVWPR